MNKILGNDYVIVYGEIINLIDITKELKPNKEPSKNNNFKFGLDDALILCKIIAFANVSSECKNVFHACRCSNEYLATFIHKTTREVRRSLETLKAYNLIFTYENKLDAHHTKERSIYPNWKYIQELTGLEMPDYEIPDYVFENLERTNLVKNNQSGGQIWSEDDQKCPPNNIRNIHNNNIHAFRITEVIPRADSDSFSALECLFAYSKYVLSDNSIIDSTYSVIEQNLDTPAEDIMEFLNDKNFDISLYADKKEDIAKGLTYILNVIQKDKEYECMEQDKEAALAKSEQDEFDAYIEHQIALSETYMDIDTDNLFY